jgi:hypothetical protein
VAFGEREDVKCSRLELRSKEEFPMKRIGHIRRESILKIPDMAESRITIHILTDICLG